MRTLPGVGNDVVDLKEPENSGKCGDERFLARVLTAEERRLVVISGEPDAILWSFWAAKEAAYKAVSSSDQAVCSIPRRYHVLLDGGESDTTKAHVTGLNGELSGRVMTPVGEVALRITMTRDYVHALVAGSAAGFAGIVHRVDRMEGGETDDPSEFVRGQLLREIARKLDCTVEDLAVRNRPSGSGSPNVYFQHQPLAAEISLSHDGRFAAFALRLAAGPGTPAG